MTAFLIILAVYIIGCAVAVYIAGRMDVEGPTAFPLVALWPVALVIVGVTYPFLWLYEKGQENKK